jgi:short-subunit dehydrogenase
VIIKGSKFVITGGNRGIGLAVAKMAAGLGAHVYIAARSLDHEMKVQIENLGASSVTFLACDLSTQAGVEQLALKLNEIEVDILFNNAGILTGGLLEEQNLEQIYSMFQVNLNALVHLSRAVLPSMIKRRQGKIINHSSVSAFMHFPCASTYAASKAAVAAFTDCLEAELVGTGVSTLCLVTPGIKTRMFDQIEVQYGKNFDVPKDSISPDDYALKIKSAIETDQKYLMPDGATGVGLWIARYMSPLFRSAVKKKFRR